MSVGETFEWDLDGYDLLQPLVYSHIASLLREIRGEPPAWILKATQAAVWSAVSVALRERLTEALHSFYLQATFDQHRNVSRIRAHLLVSQTCNIQDANWLEVAVPLGNETEGEMKQAVTSRQDV